MSIIYKICPTCGENQSIPFEVINNPAKERTLLCKKCNHTFVYSVYDEMKNDITGIFNSFRRNNKYYLYIGASILGIIIILLMSLKFGLDAIDRRAVKTFKTLIASNKELYAEFDNIKNGFMFLEAVSENIKMQQIYSNLQNSIIMTEVFRNEFIGTISGISNEEQSSDLNEIARISWLLVKKIKNIPEYININEIFSEESLLKEVKGVELATNIDSEITTIKNHRKQLLEYINNLKENTNNKFLKVYLDRANFIYFGIDKVINEINYIYKLGEKRGDSEYKND